MFERGKTVSTFCVSDTQHVRGPTCSWHVCICHSLPAWSSQQRFQFRQTPCMWRGTSSTCLSLSTCSRPLPQSHPKAKLTFQLVNLEAREVGAQLSLTFSQPKGFTAPTSWIQYTMRQRQPRTLLPATAPCLSYSNCLHKVALEIDFFMVLGTVAEEPLTERAANVNIRDTFLNNVCIIPSHDAASPLLSSKQSCLLLLPKSISKILHYLLYNLLSLSITSLYFAFRN